MATGTGNLPYPGKSYTPFDILTAEELNEDVANIESLATGTGIGDGAVTSDKIDFATYPRFSAYRNAALNSSDMGAAVPFDTELYDVGGNFNTANGRFVAPVDGDYHFDALVGNTVATNTIMLSQLRVNGVEKKNGLVFTPNTANNRSPVSADLRLSAGDYVEVWFIGGGGSVISTGESNCWFTGHLIARN